MSLNSEKVKRWRKATKQRIVESMGGCCVICGYDKVADALVLHHLNPEEKDFGFGGVRANPKRWSLIVEELRKCVLVCVRCHAEVHAGVTTVPCDAKRFDESFSEYK